MDKINVLVMDDCEEQVFTIRRLLEQNPYQDYSVTIISTFDDAILQINNTDFDVVLIDHILDDHLEINLLEHLEASTYSLPPFVMLTSVDDYEIDAQALESGFAEYIPKAELSYMVIERTIRYAITKKQFERHIKDNDALAKNILTAISDGVITLDNDNNIIYINEIAKTLLENDSENQTISSLFARYPDARLDIIDNIRNLNNENEIFNTYIDYLTKSGTKKTYEITGNIFNESEEKRKGTVLTIHDLTEVKVLEEKLTQLATHDDLTGLPNRHLLIETLKHSIIKADLDQKYFCILFLDLDGFKQVNDTLGHNAGDEIICNVAERIKCSIQKSAFLARLGGDEFCIILEKNRSYNSAITSATCIGDYISNCFKEPFTLQDKKYYLGVSTGVACYPTHGKAWQDLLKHADSAMYAAKRKYTESISIYHDLLDEQAERSLSIQSDLMRAIQNDEFILHYQPITKAISHEIVSLEALLRWEHPTRGTISPVEFIGYSEKTGQISNLTKIVLQKIKHDVNKLSMMIEDKFNISINISATLFNEKGFINHVIETLSPEISNNHLFTLEITETSLIDDPENAKATVDKLKSAGFQIALDDFGMGFCCMAYLKDLPIDMIKIDKFFISDIVENSTSRSLIGVMISLGNILQNKVVAEGVETLEQERLLYSMGCEFTQGYLISQPLPLDKVEEFIKNNDHFN